MNLFNRIPVVCALAIPLSVLISCNKLPETDFIWGPEDNPEAGDVIWFTNKTPEASFYEWRFGDESESTLENPTHIYAEPGNYEVELTGYNDAGGQTKSIT
ncbi:MAG: PKD domain-containing protein, partial [Bacteroidota bacterium]|nr:PKD domain-containing protein [Bacteroidota bacterium]